MPMQRRNAELVDNLRADFQHRNEPNFAWKSIVSAFMVLPGAIAVWPTSAVRRDSNTNRLRDVGGGGYHLNQNNNCLFDHDNLIPYVDLGGTNEYFARVDGGPADWADITGTEAHVAPDVQGLTLGTWSWLDVTPGGGGMGLLAKDLAAGNQRSYGLIMTNTRAARFHVSNAGAAISSIGSAGTVSTSEWFFAVGRFDNTGNTIAVNLNGTWTDAVYNNAVFDSGTNFEIGRFNAGNYLNGRISISFLSQVAISDAIIGALFQQTRGMFGR